MDIQRAYRAGVRAFGKSKNYPYNKGSVLDKYYKLGLRFQRNVHRGKLESLQGYKG